MSTPDEQPTAYRLREDGVSWRETDGEVVVLDVDGSVYFGLNRSATHLWKRLAGSASHLDLVSELRSRASVEQARAASDVDAFLADLLRHGLLVRC